MVNNITGVSLSASQTVTRKLTLGNGNLKTGNFDLTIAPTGNIVGASSNGYVATNDQAANSGTLKRTVTSAGPAVLFTVGSDIWKGSYTPATVTMPTGTTDVISVRVFRGVMTAGLTGTPVTSHAVNRSWVISEAVAGGSNATVELQWNDTMELSSFLRTKAGVAHHNGTSWNAPSPSGYGPSTGSNPYMISRSGITSFSVFIACDSTTNSSLPVEMLSFTGRKMNADAVLNWKTATEINNSHFELERSTDGIAFDLIEKLKGAGNSSMLTDYNFTDKNAGSNNQPVLHYRLKQVDFDGRITSYGQVTISMTDRKDGFNATMFPNPVTKDLQIGIMNSEAGTVSVFIYNMQGEMVAQKDMYIEKGSSQVTMDNLDALSSGLYFVTTSLNGNIHRQTLVKTAH